MYWWRSELRRRDAKLVPVEVVAHELRASPPDVGDRSFELVVGEMRLLIPHGFDAAELRRLIAALTC